ncbi:hypothetical protein V6N11_084217 [Hibiscus sabdariffa]|uniref:Uncharacterized protein n=1 Tax=Hibiscus sabdariffa TaxID=183260 RepID=A0ABR2QSV9_9ROSI
MHVEQAKIYLRMKRKEEINTSDKLAMMLGGAAAWTVAVLESVTISDMRRGPLDGAAMPRSTEKMDQSADPILAAGSVLNPSLSVMYACKACLIKYWICFGMRAICYECLRGSFDLILDVLWRESYLNE